MRTVTAEPPAQGVSGDGTVEDQLQETRGGRPGQPGTPSPTPPDGKDPGPPTNRGRMDRLMSPEFLLPVLSAEAGRTTPGPPPATRTSAPPRAYHSPTRTARWKAHPGREEVCGPPRGGRGDQGLGPHQLGRPLGVLLSALSEALRRRRGHQLVDEEPPLRPATCSPYCCRRHHGPRFSTSSRWLVAPPLPRPPPPHWIRQRGSRKRS